MKERLFSPIRAISIKSILRPSRPRLPKRKHTGKLLGLLRGHGAQMSQIALVSDQHDDDVGVGMVAEFLQPPVDVVVGLVLADIVDKEGPDGTTVVGGGDGAITLLTGGIPDLRLDRLGVDLDGTGGEFDTDGRLGVQVELIASETTQQVGLSDARVSNQHHCWPYWSVQGLKSPLFFFFIFTSFSFYPKSHLIHP